MTGDTRVANTSIVVRAEDEDAMVALGHKLGEACAQGALILLDGELGAGKTTLCRGVLRARGHSGAVKSPTYTLVEPYADLRPPVFHFDLYRLGDPEELMYMGIRDYFEEPAIVLVEWPQRGRGFLPSPDLTVSIVATPREREVTINAHSASGAPMLDLIAPC